MSLSIDARNCGAVYVIRCTGRIVAGDESKALEAAIGRSLLEFRRFVIDLGGVIRLDSSGIGLMVRYLSHTRSRGGDLRLSTAPPVLADLLRVTKLTSVFKVYDSEEEAILSFLKEPMASENAQSNAGPAVLFVDHSSDLCAFARAFLESHGFRVSSTCRTYDARLLLMAGRFDYVVMGPDSAQNTGGIVKGSSQKPALVQLPAEFKYDKPERAGAELLRLLEHAREANA